MAAKGTQAKIEVLNKIKEVFGKDFIGEIDKKIYVWAQDAGERVQIAISLTCPKNPVGMVSTDGAGYDFSAPTIAASQFTPAEFTEEEKNNINELIKALNL